MTTISISRDELLAKLNEAKAKADKEDAKAHKAHQKVEDAALKQFRVNLREAMTWDYETAKKNNFRVAVDRPYCPQRNASSIEAAIRQVNLDSRKARFRLSTASDWYRAATWLPTEERIKQSVCD